jgi:SWI/SNF-related matrix-associated actin-dependent regulator 1 of chromatin subfamily A
MIIGYPMKGWLDAYPGPDDPDFTDAECERLNLIPGVQCYPKALRVSYTAEPILREYLGQWGYSFDRWAPGRTHFSEPLSPPGLYPHQVEGVQTLYGNGGGLLCDEMGLGKSRTAAVAAHKQCEHIMIDRIVLIIGPKFTRDVWRAELEALGYLEDGGANFIALEGRDPTTAKSRLDTVRFRAYAKAQGLGGTWVFIHYDILPEWQGTIYSWGFGACILDEAHFAREGRNKRSKAVAAVMGAVPFRIALTGTPLVNKPAELWHLLTLVCGPGTWGHAMTFRTRYCGAMRDEYGLQDHAPTHVDELRERMTGIYIRRTAASVGAAMVPFSRQTLTADLGAQEEAYFTAESKVSLPELVRAVLEGRAGTDVLAQLGKLRKLTARAKIPTTVAYVNSLLEAGESVVVFSHERATAEAIFQKVASSWPDNADGFVVTGELPDDERVRLVEHFQREGGHSPHVLCATYGALGVGVTLTAARYVVLHDLEWTFASVLQAEKRVHRLSSARGPVTAAWVIAEHTVDEIMAQILLMKAEYLSQTLGQRDALDAAAELDLKGIAGLDDFEDRMLAWAKSA